MLLLELKLSLWEWGNDAAEVWERTAGFGWCGWRENEGGEVLLGVDG